MALVKRLEPSDKERAAIIHIALHYTAKIVTVKRLMNEHPIPRNVTGFQFQLIGNMTLKQFGYLLAGVLLAVAFFRAPISIFRFPLAGLFAFLGIAFAFIPIQERPLEIWLVNLIKSIYSPTQYVWEKEIRIPELFTQKTSRTKPARETQTRLDTRNKLATYLASVAQREEDRLDAQETQTLQKVSSLFSQKIPVRPVISPLASISRLFVKEPTMTHHTTPALQKGTVRGLVRVGQTVLPGILIHITNIEGQQIRLFKTNSQGTFGSTIPLDNGTYHLSIEDPSKRYYFKPFSFEISTEGLHPWLIAPEGELS